MNIFQRIAAITADLGAIAKGGRAPDKIGGFAYHGIDAIEDALRPLFIKHGVVCVPSLLSSENRSVGKMNITTAQVKLVFVNIEEPTDRLEMVTGADGLDTGDKSPGKAFSYALKTAYLALFHARGQTDNEADGLEHEMAPRRSDAEILPLGLAIKASSLSKEDVAAHSESTFGANPRRLAEPQLSELIGWVKAHPINTTTDAADSAAA